MCTRETVIVQWRNVSITVSLLNISLTIARRAGSDDSMSASGPAGPGFDPRRGSKFSFENFQPRD